MKETIKTSERPSIKQRPNSKGKEAVISIPVLNVPKFFGQWTGVNPRVISKGKIFQTILHTLINEPETFYDQNRGLLLSVQDMASESRGLSVILKNKEMHGMVDGGHTFAAINEAIEIVKDLEAPVDLSKAYVTVRIRSVRTKEDVLAMAKGWNTDKKVEDHSIANQAGYFQTIKDAMVDHPGTDEIRYYEGDTGFIDVREVIQLMLAFDRERYGDDKCPSDIYGRKGKALKMYIDDINSKGMTHLKALATNAHEVLRAYDLMRRQIPISWNKTGKRCGYVCNKAKTTLPFLDSSTDYVVALGIFYPVFAALRANINWPRRSTKLNWIIPIDDFILSTAFDRIVKRYVPLHADARRGGAPRPESMARYSHNFYPPYDVALVGVKKLAARTKKSN